MPGSSEVNAEAFSFELQHATTPYGSSVRLTSETVTKRLGPKAFEPSNRYRLATWLNHLEDSHRIVYYICDKQRSSVWTRRCIRQTDCILVLHMADSKFSDKPTMIETALKEDQTKVTKVLVLLHSQHKDYPTVGRTAQWLNSRPWISQHFHIRCPSRVLAPRNKQALVSLYTQVFTQEKPNPFADMSRLARCLTGKAIGLVLGGGGARGAAHVGIIKIFQEAGIPVDMIGGTSIGSFMGALWAEEPRIAPFTQRAREFCSSFTSLWAKLKDLTYPTVSIFSGREFNSALKTVFKNRQIEDLWLPFFCITTDITNCKMRVHSNGELWRFVRASMSYPILLPPIGDPMDGALLVDGVFTNNVPGI
ncbi:Neuropathy target esterase [Cichlidogyrus casuarinus]|uniref:Neuropathy target esterase n=1 Tax=Cichlidogyrus casuarinus TaxID=1844966 RepID=A0ABD2Q8X2_9PLAT